MSRWRRGDGGVYAILYAVLVVVLMGMGAIVVDLASVRADRRLDRSAADSAATAGARFLDTETTGGIAPYQACLAAWAYLSDALQISVPSGACSSFATINAAAYCATPSPAEIDDNSVVGSRTIRIAWPVPRTGGSGMLRPDIAPGNLPDQDFLSSADGSDKGCDRLGVAIFHTQVFGLGGGIGVSGTNTQVHSVALFRPNGPELEGVAALVVLNPDQCQAIVSTGGGKVLVGAVLKDGVVVGPGAIGVESAGTGGGCNGGNKVIEASGGGSLICASAVNLTDASSCDGQGYITSHALDPGGDATKAYSTAATAGGNLKPVPVPPGEVHSWNPVTKRYGCNVSALSPCVRPATNYIAELEAAYGSSGTPTVYTASEAPYLNLYSTPFQTTSAICGNVSTVVVLPPGNWYANCSLSVRNGGTVVIQGGNLVLGGDLEVKAGGCFVLNSSVTSCPSTVSGTGTAVTSVTPPVSDSHLYLRNGAVTTQGTIVMPQTFVYSRSSSNNPVDVRSDALTLWTAPGAGARNASGRTNLEQACFDAGTGKVVVACMDSRFARVSYWSDYPAPKTSANNFGGQGNLNVVGIFFTPRGYFDFSGGGAFKAAAAQFWTDKLNVTGSAVLGLIPDAKFSVASARGQTSLIR